MRYDELTEKSNFEWQHGTFPLPQDGAGFTSDDDDDDDTIDTTVPTDDDFSFDDDLFGEDGLVEDLFDDLEDPLD